MSPTPDLPPVEERFVANSSQYVAALEAMAAVAERAAEAQDRLVAGIEAMQAAMDAAAAGAAEAAAAEGHLAEEEAAVATGAAEATAGLDRIDASLRTLVAYTAAAVSELHDLRTALAGVALVAVAASAATADAGAGAARAAIGFRMWGLGLLLTRNALHWVVAGAAEFLAVAVPAAYALAAGLAVAAQGAQDVQQHFSALYAATESTYAAFGKTVGSVLGLGSALQRAQNAANPGVYEILGSAINDARARFSDFAGIGLQVVHMFDEFSARVTVDLQGALGTQLHGLLSGAVVDLQRFGNVLGNLGHALLNFASAMPGLANFLLQIAVHLSQVIEWASRGGVLLTFAMGLEEMYRWGGLVLSMLVRLTGATAAMNALGSGGFIFRFGAALQALIGVGGAAIAWIGNFIARMSAMVGASEAAGAAISQFGFDLQIAGATMSPGMTAAIAGGVAALVGLIVVLNNVKDATDRWVASSDQAVKSASDLQVFNVIGKTMAENAIRMSAAQASLAASSQRVGEVTGVSSRYLTGYSGVTQRAAQDVQDLTQQQQYLIATGTTVATNIGVLARAFNTSATGALALANAAGVNLQIGLTKGSTALKIAEQQITNLKTGLGAMAAPVGVIGADMEAMGIQSQLASSKVGQVNQALDQFVGTLTGGMTGVAQFEAALNTMGHDALSSSVGIDGAIRSISRSAAQMGFTLQGFGPKAQQSWQQFGAAVQQGQQVLDTFRTGMAEGMVSAGQYNKAIMDVAGSLLPFAAHSRTATAIVSALAQEAGLPATSSFRTLAAQLGVTGKTARDQLAAGMEQAVTRMSNLSAVARNLSATVSGQLDQAMAGAIVKASGLDQAYLRWATDVKSNAAPKTLAADLRGIQSAQNFVNSAEAKGTSLLNDNAKAAGNLGSAFNKASGAAGDYSKTLGQVHTALENHTISAKAAALSTEGFGQQTRTATSATSGLTSSASGTNAQVKALGQSATATRASLGTVNNEIRATASAASGADGPLGSMSGMIRGVGSAASSAAGQVYSLQAAINSLQSKTITITTNMVTTTSHRAGGGPVAPNVPYLVGEAGQEIFVPSQPGTIIPAPETQRIMAGTGGRGGDGGQVAPQVIRLEIPVHVQAMVDEGVLFDTTKRLTAVYNVRNGNAQSGTLAPRAPVG